ncbi:hypothetical protein DEA98_21520 [Brucella pseudogrignonensis]|nr:hypothetical protein [Brucella pseudogrignonensis]
MNWTADHLPRLQFALQAQSLQKAIKAMLVHDILNIARIPTRQAFDRIPVDARIIIAAHCFVLPF